MRKKKKSSDSRAVGSMEVDSEEFNRTAFLWVDSKEESANLVSLLNMPISNDFSYVIIDEKGEQPAFFSKLKKCGPRKRKRT